ncbi:hypothetical protein K450DRAFT_257445 [Umbelopsis ramanniana AG]|uniref:Uncharacterized protein n=1 Tax=Umbelopsis ramanniana AG TaxID=1314678 RepID=A0AAD5E657_UMBRA|nr:uncharacterized protein K450DRAFT_257445 [Umbelopsis ramanniana AG]KAI8576370.1 hypothetical protein K450DRAFT_257445 [Umbelopsis ramanniana AG]
MSLDPTFHGFVETTMDTLLLFEACRQGLLPKVTRRLQDRERKDLVVSGTVFIFDERESGIKRWTDGLLWSPSRILGNFLVYREIDKRSPIVDKRQQSVDPSAPTSTAERLKERALVGSLTNSYKFKRNGLIKKTMSIVVNGSTQHMISYYNKEDVASGRLHSPRSIPMLANLEVSPEFLQRQNFRIPLHVETSGVITDRTSTSPTLSTVYYDAHRRESQASTSSDVMSTESSTIDTHNYLQPYMRQPQQSPLGYNAPRFSPQHPYLDNHAAPVNYPPVSMPNTPIPSPSSDYRMRKSSDPALMYQNRGPTTTPDSMSMGAHPNRHAYTTMSAHHGGQYSGRGLEGQGMPPPPNPSTPANDASYGSMNWNSYRADPRLPTTAGPYETSFSFPSHTPRTNFQNHHRHHSDPRHNEVNMGAPYSNTHLPPIMQQTSMMNTYSGGGGNEQIHEPGTSESTDIPPLAQFDEAYRGGGGSTMHHGLLEHNSMRMPSAPYQPSTPDPRGHGHDQFNNVPMGSNFHVPEVSFNPWDTYK